MSVFALGLRTSERGARAHPRRLLTLDELVVVVLQSSPLGSHGSRPAVAPATGKPAPFERPPHLARRAQTEDPTEHAGCSFERLGASVRVARAQQVPSTGRSTDGRTAARFPRRPALLIHRHSQRAFIKGFILA